MRLSRRLLTFVLFLHYGICVGAPPPVTDLKVHDRANDDGTALDVAWKLPPEAAASISRIDVFAAAAEKEPVKVAETTPAGTSAVVEDLEPGVPVTVRVVTVGLDETTSEPAETAEPITPIVQWFNRGRVWLAILLAVVCGAVLAYIAAARRGMALWIRPIAGLEAVTDAVGRAVEMGKSVLFVPGVQDINDIQTVAGVTLLSRVARIAAEYDAEIKVPTGRSLVMATCRETVQASFLAAGRPEAYNPDDIFYLTDEQFGFAAGVTGQMAREKPAACFYLGAFYAESLIFAEIGSGIGAIQVAGTAEAVQLPFFVAACDYTLIGEEFFAASAYLSGEPQQLGSLKGQDFGKLLCGLLIVVGCLTATAASLLAAGGEDTLGDSFATISEYLRDNMLGDAGFLKETGE